MQHWPAVYLRECGILMFSGSLIQEQGDLVELLLGVA